ncbi:hypothetical protein [Archangium violaceum]|uniref:Uncharacterized protein n=1 Tax=Archangium violaceum Cb vi76 TaxID=1406225 RepID=A0A084SW53_9BACT|nr:hypothetical protein [Archangium violaceum]KFA92688.1 hypothetical protein Q664_13890 [Archangium violaceum Cb vi76]
MTQDDKDIITPTTENHPDKRKGQMSIREAAAMEMPQLQHMETGIRGVPVHGFGNGTETVKRHTGMGTDTGMAMNVGTAMDSSQTSAGESVTKIIDQVFELPFHAQLSVMRMLASRVLGAMDARDREGFLNGLRMEMEHAGEDTGVETSEARTTNMPDTPDIQGT